MFRVVIACIALAFSQFAFAGEMPPKPDSCPATSSLKTTPFFMAQEQEGQGWVDFSMGNFGTSDFWGFALAFVKAGNMMEALDIGNKMLPSLQGNPKPMPIDTPDVQTWACMYGVDGPYQVVALSPLPMGANIGQIIKSVR